jgi:hypothetical protein
VSEYHFNYSGRRLVESLLMGSFGLLDQVEPNLPVANFSFIPNVCTVKPVYNGRPPLGPQKSGRCSEGGQCSEVGPKF